MKHFGQLEKFNRTVEQHPQLAVKVKYLGLNQNIENIAKIRDNLEMSTFNLLTTLLSTYWPNIEALDQKNT